MVKIRMRTWKLGNVFVLLLGLGWIAVNFISMFKTAEYTEITKDMLTPFVMMANVIFYLILTLFWLTENLYDEYEVEMKGKKIGDCCDVSR
jgi:hypothetical protein